MSNTTLAFIGMLCIGIGLWLLAYVIKRIKGGIRCPKCKHKVKDNAFDVFVDEDEIWHWKCCTCGHIWKIERRKK